MIFYVLLLMTTGLISLLAPRFWWLLRRWQFRNPEAVEPSDLAYTVTRVAGGLQVLLAVIGLGVVTSEDRNEKAREALENSTTSSTMAPYDMIEQFSQRLYARATERGVPVRQLEWEEISKLSYRTEVGDYGPELTAYRMLDYGQTGMIQLVYGRTSRTERYCATYPEQGDPAIEERSCVPPVMLQETRVRKAVDAIMKAAAEAGTSPRVETLVKKTARPWFDSAAGDSELRTFGVQSTGRFTMNFSRRESSGPNFWCVILPEEPTGTPAIWEYQCGGPDQP